MPLLSVDGPALHLFLLETAEKAEDTVLGWRFCRDAVGKKTNN